MARIGLFLVFLSLSCFFQPAGAYEESEGLIFPDNYTPEAGETIPWKYDQRAIQWPRILADSKDTFFWGVYIESAEYDPPSFIIVYVKDDTPLLTRQKKIDLLVKIGRWDAAHNFIEYRRRVIRDIPLEQNRLTRIPVNVQVYKGEIMISKLLDVKMDNVILQKDNY